MSIEKEIEKLSKAKERFLDNSVKGLDKNIREIQKRLLELIFASYMDKFDLVDGSLADTSKNYRLIAEMDKVFDKFSKLYQNDIVKGFGKDLVSLTLVTGEYYKDMGVVKKTVDNIAKKLGFMDQAIGIEGNKIIKGSYLDRLARSQEVRQRLKDYVTGSIIEKKSFTSYKRGMGEIIQGKRGVDGALESYWRSYAYDSYYQVDAAKNSFFADQVGFDYFIYFGQLIATSREFCIKRAGKVFSKEDAMTWKCDPTLLRRKGITGCDDTYNFAVERGRWNCQHQINWISKEIAEQLGVTEMRY